MIQILSINKALMGGQKLVNDIECNITTADTPLQAFNHVIQIRPDIIVLNMDQHTMETDGVIIRLKKMQAAEDIPILMLAEYEEDVKEYLNDGRTFMLPDDEEDSAIIEWIIKKLKIRPKDRCKRILVVDDDPAVLDLVKMYLGARYDVKLANSAEKAFGVLENEVPDLILLDIAMPGMDGKETIKRLKKDSRLSKVPVLFETGMAGVNTVKECMALGAVGFVVKPVQKNKLRAKIEEVLGLTRGARKKIVLIDEYEFHFSLIANFLEDNFDVIKAPSTLYAISVIEDVAPSFILLNGDNSLYLLSKVREKANALHIPIVLMARTPVKELVEQERKKPHTFLVTTPLTRESLLEAFESVDLWN